MQYLRRQSINRLTTAPTRRKLSCRGMRHRWMPPYAAGHFISRSAVVLLKIEIRELLKFRHSAIGTPREALISYD
ncbi:hypothetical protein CBM2594_P180007 [Cupriavidus taiwanensis]|uniref:Uncharacterized protein n=3 Tax=Cupriavidus TaxID=106589 RepID=A0A7Z7NPP3_9BURK|nr:hypothetical protein CBM2594_P180007 [Cupriavidus taiwanensis]